MNLTQFLERWPAKDSRLFLFAGGKDHDRLSCFQLVADHWRNKVDRLDVTRVHSPSYEELLEACRQDPIAGKTRVVIATEVPWIDPEDKTTAPRTKALARFLEDFPRDICLITSTPEPNPLTKNDVAQPIIRKGYWVVLKNTDAPTATQLLEYLTHWDTDLCRDVVAHVGTSPSDLIALIKTVRLAGIDPKDTPDQLHAYLTETQPRGVFELVEAVVRKDLPAALSIARNEIPTGQFAGALDRKLTTLLQFMGEMKKGRSPGEAVHNLRIAPFLAHGLYEASKRWTPPEIITLFPILAQHGVHNQRPASNDVLLRQLIDA